MKNDTWQRQGVKSKFGQLVEKAIHHELQFVAKHGNHAVVVLSFDDYKKITKSKTDLVTFLRNSPLMGEKLDDSRGKDLPRDITL